jgi:hypothetical protein
MHIEYIAAVALALAVAAGLASARGEVGDRAVVVAADAGARHPW